MRAKRANLMGTMLMSHEKEIIQAVLSLLDNKNDKSLDERLIDLIKERKKQNKERRLSRIESRVQHLAYHAGVANDEL
jgi:hypothetical protein